MQIDFTKPLAKAVNSPEIVDVAVINNGHNQILNVVGLTSKESYKKLAPRLVELGQRAEAAHRQVCACEATISMPGWKCIMDISTPITCLQLF